MGAPKKKKKSPEVEEVEDVEVESSGEVSEASTVLDAPPSEGLVRETRAQAGNRWVLEGRRAEADRFREEARLECQAKGMSRFDSNAHAWAATIAAFPPKGKPAVTLPIPEPAESSSSSPSPESGQVQGLGRIPADWPALPPNASLQAELAWVQANRLSIVGQASSGATVVCLDKARSPAPSMAALGWLETSIRSYAKYVDVLARAMGTSVDEVEHVRRERMAIEEIRALLKEMRQ